MAEKEVSALKEQLAAANDSNSKTEGHQLSQPPQGSDQQQVHDASNPRRTPNSNFEQELQAKDKEVSPIKIRMSPMLERYSARVLGMVIATFDLRTECVRVIKNEVDKEGRVYASGR